MDFLPHCIYIRMGALLVVTLFHHHLIYNYYSTVCNEFRTSKQNAFKAFENMIDTKLELPCVILIICVCSE